MKKVSIFLFLAVFAYTGTLVDQLFWDSDMAYEYASQFASLPEVPYLPSAGELGIDGRAAFYYDSLQQDVAELRKLRSEAVVLAREVQEDSLSMKKKVPFIKNMVLSFFGRGLRSGIERLVGTAYKLDTAQGKFMQNDLELLMELLDEEEDLSEFSGRVALPNGVTYMDLRMRVEGMDPLESSPTILPRPLEPSCSIETSNGTVSIPRYLLAVYFPGVTSPCTPEGFYTRGQLEDALLRPDMHEFRRRLLWVRDLKDYLLAVSEFLGSREREAVKKLDQESLVVSQAEALNSILSNSSVRLALSLLQGSGELVASSWDVPTLSGVKEAYEKLFRAMEAARVSKSSGEKFLGYERVLVEGSYMDGLVASAWSYLTGQVETMEALCRSYGRPCEYDGELPQRLLLTSQAFLDARIEYLEENQLQDEADRLSLELAESELNFTLELLERIEPYLDVSELMEFKDELRVLQRKVGLSGNLGGEGASEVLAGVRAFKDHVEERFFEKYRDRAMKIKAELLSLSQFLRDRGVDVKVEDRKISAFSGYVDSIIYYLSREPYLEEMREKYDELLKDFSSNLPSRVLCYPEKPVLGRPFDVHCAVLVNNSWGVQLDSASSVLDLPFPPRHIDSQNFVGDTSYLSSVSFSGDTVRLNLKDVGPIVIFNVSYESLLDPAYHHCSYSVDGLEAEARCVFISGCEFETVLVPIEHPFSGRRMNSTAPFFYDGSEVLVEVPCGEHNVSFFGPSVEVLSSGDELTVKNLINSTAELSFEIPARYVSGDMPAMVGVALDPLEEKRVALRSNFELEPPGEPLRLQNGSLNSSLLFGYSSYGEAYEHLSDKIDYTTYGCVEANVVSEVLENFRLPPLKCIRLPELEEVKRLHDLGDDETAVKKYMSLVRSAGLESFLSRSLKHRGQAKELLAQVESLNPLSSRLASGYIEKARDAYEHGDYITSMYYSRYALLKSTVKLNLDFRVILALAVLAYGIYSSRDKEEELI